MNLGHGRASAGIVEDFFHDATDVAATFGVVNGTELDGPLARAGVGLEDGGFALSLRLSVMEECEIMERVEWFGV